MGKLRSATSIGVLSVALLAGACGGSQHANVPQGKAADAAIAPDASAAAAPASSTATEPVAAHRDVLPEAQRASSASGGFAARLPRRRVAIACCDLALERLGTTQRDDGSWATDDGALDLATTGAALLCFSGFGETHQAGAYKETVKSALVRLTGSHHEEAGLGQWDGADARLGTALAVAALSEIHGLTGSRLVRGPAQRDLDTVVAALRAGSFRTDDDPVVSAATCLMLDAAARGGLNLPGDWREMSARAIPAGPDDGRWAAASLLRRIVLSPDKKHVDDDAGRALAARLVERLPQVRDVEELWITGVAASIVGGEAWNAWRDIAKERVIDTQHQRSGDTDRGSWDPVGERASRAGRTFATAVADLAAQVYFEYTYALGAHQPPPER